MFDNLKFHWNLALLACAIIFATSGASAASGTWKSLEHAFPGDYPDMGLLLTDGTVMAHNGCSSDWYKLTPDVNGDYAKGTWTQIASLPSDYQPLYFAAQVLADGRAMVSGGEYDGCTSVAETDKGALYDPQTDSWTNVPPPPGWLSIGNAASAVRADKKYQVANCCASDLAIATIEGTDVTWQVLKASQTGKNDSGIDETWTALPDQRLLTIDTSRCNRPDQISCTEIFDINTNTWSDGQNACGQLVLAGGSAPPALGPSILLPNGFVFQMGGDLEENRVNCVMDTKTGTWTAAPPLPDDLTGQWAPAAVLPNGNVLVQLNKHHLNPPSRFFEVSVRDAGHVTYAEVDAPPIATVAFSFEGRMLLLPTGQVLLITMHDANHREVDIYTPKGSPKDAWRPVVRKVNDTLARGSKNNKIKGRNFNGFTYGAAYGGGMQMSTNYPLMRLTNTVSRHVCYARTHDHNRMGIADGSKSSTKFDIPAACEAGAATLEVVANGIASKPVAVTLQ